MVETSDNLRALQVKALGATFAPTASYSASRGGGGGGGAKEVEGSPMQLPGGGEVVWHTAIEQVGTARSSRGMDCIVVVVLAAINALWLCRREFRVLCDCCGRAVEIAWCGLHIGCG